MYINTLEIIRKYVVVGKEFSFTNVTILKPDVVSKFFKPVFGTALLDQIESFEAQTVGTPQKTAFTLVENALSKLILNDYLTQGQLLIEDSAVTRRESDNSKTAYKNQILDSKEMYEETALTLIDELIDVLNANPTIFTAWATAPGKLNLDSVLIKSAAEFHEVERLFRKNTTFNHLVPMLKICTDLYLKAKFDTALISQLIANASLSTEKKQLREYLKVALVNFTIASAMSNSLVKFSRDGLFIQEQNSDTASSIQTKADLDAVGITIKNREKIAYKYMDLGEKYINANLTAFGLSDAIAPYMKTGEWM